ncbi:MAG: glucose-1-phosphate thymidylyltransferase [Spirochaetales bacterium]|nr:glucose-1-phosphate thymidylyltransferase [Spirochaetales bacterium]
MILFDEDQPLARPFNRFFSCFLLRDGLLSPLERLSLSKNDSRMEYYHPDAEFAALRAAQYGWKVHDSSSGGERLKIPFSPARMLAEAGQRIVEDLQLVSGYERRDPANTFPGVHFLGRDFWIHPGAEIMPGCVLDSRSGPVVLDTGVRISPFSYIEGPLFAGTYARLDNVRLTGGVILGRSVRVGGEIENSIVGDFSNKHHEGFLGHSIVGRWVNLGALTTTSDLKNNYGPVRFQIPGEDGVMQTLDAGTIKMGSLIGDCVKTAIGSLLSTGTVVDAGACILGKTGRYVKPLAWGNDAIYDPERFARDALRIFPRRKEQPPAQLLGLARLAARGYHV